MGHVAHPTPQLGCPVHGLWGVQLIFFLACDDGARSPCITVCPPCLLMITLWCPAQAYSPAPGLWVVRVPDVGGVSLGLSSSFLSLPHDGVF